MAVGAPVRGEGLSKIKRPGGGNEAQNAALRDIFQTNMDLRRSLEKLAVATANMRPADPMKDSAPRETIMGPREPSSPRDRALQSQPAA